MYRLSPVNQNLIKKEDVQIVTASPEFHKEGCQEEILVAPECIIPLERLTSQIA